MTHHSWPECRPTFLDWGNEVINLHREEIMLAWLLVSDRDRALFHDFYCLGRHDDETVAAMKRIGNLVRMLVPGQA